MSVFGWLSFVFVILAIIMMLMKRVKIKGIYYHEICTFLWLVCDIADCVILDKGYTHSVILLVLLIIFTYVRVTKVDI